MNSKLLLRPSLAQHVDLKLKRSKAHRNLSFDYFRYSATLGDTREGVPNDEGQGGGPQVCQEGRAEQRLPVADARSQCDQIWWCSHR